MKEKYFTLLMVLIVPIGNLLYSYSQKPYVREFMINLDWSGITPFIEIYILLKGHLKWCLFIVIIKLYIHQFSTILYSEQYYQLTESI